MPNYRTPIAKPLMEKEEQKAVADVLYSGDLAQGKKVEEFEKEFAKYIGVKYCIAVNSGTAALHLALLSLGIDKNDEVITTAFSFAASANCVLFCGATPIFSDINLKTFNIDPSGIEDKINSRTKCIIPVHLYGQPADMNVIKEIADAHGLFVVEDAAQAHGAEYKNRKVGSISDLGCFSFYPTKNMTTGEGGAITTNDEKLAEKLRLLRNHGQIKQYYHSILGFNFRMTDIAAAIGIEQLKKLDKFNTKRIGNAKFLTDGLSGIANITTPFISPDVKHVFNQYTVRLTKGKISRDAVQKKLEEAGIQTKVYYPIPIHKQVLYQKFCNNLRLENAERASEEVLSIPVHPSLSEEDLEFIVEKTKSV